MDYFCNCKHSKAVTDTNEFKAEKPNHDEDSTINNKITNAFELLDTSIQHGSNNMKDMDSSLNLVISLMEKVRLKEKSVEEAKEEAAKSGLDILAKAEALKREQQRVKETNDMVKQSRECAMTDKNAFDVDKPNHEEDSTMITTAFQLLDASIQHGSHNMKAMDSSLNLVISLMEEVRLKEKSAKEAKEEAAVSGFDILAKAEALKREQQRVNEANYKHAREVYAQKAVLAKELKELQLRMFGVLREGDGYLGDFDEMFKVLKQRLIIAVTEKELSDKENQEKEKLALEVLALEESQMSKLVEESERLRQEAVNNSKLQDLFNEREFVVNVLREDILGKYRDMSSLRERIDQPVMQPGGFISANKTPTCFTSCSFVIGFLTPIQELQKEPLKETADEHAKINLPRNELLNKDAKFGFGEVRMWLLTKMMRFW